MFEPFVPVFIAAATGFAVLTNRIYNRIAILDQRIDLAELRAVQEFVTKDDFNNALNRVEAHLIRMEDKIDMIANKKCES